MVTQAPKRLAVFVALGFTLSCIGLIAFVWTQFGGTIPFAAAGYRIKALFGESGLLVAGADVRISGVNVGRVTAVQPRGAKSLVTMRIDPQYVPIPRDTRAILREKTLLGEGFVMLSTGNRNAPALPDGGTLPASQVQPTQQLDQVLDSFGPRTQRNLRAILIGTGNALAGRGQTLNDAIGNLDPASAELAAIVGVLEDQQGNLRSLIADGATVLQTLGQRSADLQSLIVAGNRVLRTTAAEPRELTATVDRLSPFLVALRETLGRLNNTLGLARPPLAQLRVDAPLLPAALRRFDAALAPARELLSAAPPLLAAAERALPAIAAFAHAFRPAVDELLPAAQQISPVIDYIAEYRTELTTAMATLAATLQATVTPGGQDHYIRALSTIGRESLYGQPARDPTTRDNTYFAPGELANIARGGLKAASCANTTNPSTAPLAYSNVPCRVQGGYRWGNGIATAYFPRLTAAPK
jgi:phospholipid/cholesterol/gamma-HCH transport system substrate-binding protein